MISPFFVSTDTTDPSASCSKTIGIPTLLFPTTDILYNNFFGLVTCNCDRNWCAVSGV